LGMGLWRDLWNSAQRWFGNGRSKTDVQQSRNSGCPHAHVAETPPPRDRHPRSYPQRYGAGTRFMWPSAQFALDNGYWELPNSPLRLSGLTGRFAVPSRRRRIEVLRLPRWFSGISARANRPKTSGHYRPNSDWMMIIGNSSIPLILPRSPRTYSRGTASPGLPPPAPHVSAP